MADQQVEDLTEVSVPALGDLNLTVDVSDTTDDLGGTTGKLTHQRKLGLTSLNDFRLSLEQDVPLSSSDQSAKTTIYCNPWRGNRIVLHDGTRRVLCHASSFSVAVPSTTFRHFDVFGYLSGSTPTLECVNWNLTSGSITAATGASVEAQLTSNSHGLSNGDLVGITGMGGNTNPNGGIWRVSSVATNTFNLQGCIGNATYTSGGTWHKLTGCTRATALAYSEGWLSKSGDTSKIYLGTGLTTGTSGQCQDTSRWCFLWNYYNQLPRHVTAADTGSHTLTTSTSREWNAYNAGVSVKTRCGMVAGDAGIALGLRLAARKSSANDCNFIANPLLNTGTTGPLVQINTTKQGLTGSCGYATRAALGLNSLSILEVEYSGADSAPDYGYTVLEFLG